MVIKCKNKNFKKIDNILGWVWHLSLMALGSTLESESGKRSSREGWITTHDK